jgi:transcription antitermination factor NusG
VTLPVYPGYIFVHIGMENESIYLLTHAPTKAWFVRFGGLISVIPEGVITELRRLELARELMREEVVSHPFNPGRKVIVHFPTADIHAVVLRLLNESRVVVDSPLGNITVPVHKLSLR